MLHVILFQLIMFAPYGYKQKLSSVIMYLSKYKSVIAVVH